jgi:hypothetical protein
MFVLSVIIIINTKAVKLGRTTFLNNMKHKHYFSWYEEI